MGLGTSLESPWQCWQPSLPPPWKDVDKLPVLSDVTSDGLASACRATDNCWRLFSRSCTLLDSLASLICEIKDVRNDKQTGNLHLFALLSLSRGLGQLFAQVSFRFNLWCSICKVILEIAPQELQWPHKCQEPSLQTLCVLLLLKQTKVSTFQTIEQTRKLRVSISCSKESTRGQTSSICKANLPQYSGSILVVRASQLRTKRG